MTRADFENDNQSGELQGWTFGRIMSLHLADVIGTDCMTELEIGMEFIILQNPWVGSVKVDMFQRLTSERLL